MTLTFESFGSTHTGRVREVNEDSFLVRGTSGLWAVADGMGGHHAGKLASTSVVDALSGVADTGVAGDFLAGCTRSLAAANLHLRETAREMRYPAIGATVVMLLIRDGSYACVWSGDSRIYRIRDGETEQLTRDHSEVEELIQRGLMSREDAKDWPRRNVITRAIGVADDPELEIVEGKVSPGDVFVLCSDGLTNHVSDDEIGELAGGEDVREASEALIALTLDRGAKDNVTAIVVRCAMREPTLVTPGTSAAAAWGQS